MIFLLTSASHRLHWWFFYARAAREQDAGYVWPPFATILGRNPLRIHSTQLPCPWLHLLNVLHCCPAFVVFSWMFLTLLVPRMKMRIFLVDGDLTLSCLHHGTRIYGCELHCRIFGLRILRCAYIRRTLLFHLRYVRPPFWVQRSDSAVHFACWGV